MIIVRLRQLGAEIIPVAWTYPSRRIGPLKFSTDCMRGTQYQGDFQKRADEATRFKAKRDRKAGRPGTGSPSSRTIFR